MIRERQFETAKILTTPPAYIRVHIDGFGARPDGKGPGFAWIQEGTRKQHVGYHDGLTTIEAEYLALQSALEALPVDSSAEVFTKSMLVCWQFNGKYRVRDFRISQLLGGIKEVIAKNQLTVKVNWMDRQKNLAGKLN